LARLGTVAELTSMVIHQRVVVNQTRRIQDEKHDALDAALLADTNAVVLLEYQKKVHRGCRLAFTAAQEALDVAIDDLEDASALLKLREATCEVTGDNLAGLHYSLEDARDLHLSAANYLIYLDKCLNGHISQLID